MVSSPAIALEPARAPLHRYHLAVAVLAVVAFFPELPLYLHVQRAEFLPKFAYFLFAALALPVVFVRQEDFLRYLCSPFPVWAGCFLLLNLLHWIALVPSGNPDADGVVLLRMQLSILAIILGFLVSSAPPSDLIRVFPPLAFALAALLVFDFLNPGFLYPPGSEGVIPGRAAGTLLNSNKAGEALMLITVFAMAAVPKQMRLVLLAFAAAGVLVTFGRNSIIAWVWVACLLAAAGTVPRVGIVLLGAVALSAAMFASLLADYVSGRPELVEAANDIVARLSFFTTGQATDDSAGMRLLVAEAGIQMFLDQPLFGAGAGATHFWSLPVSPHNQPVMLAAEYGVAGLVLWGWLMVQLWRGAFFAERPLQIAGALLAVYFSFFSHNLFDFVYWLISFALLSSRQAEATSAR